MSPRPCGMEHLGMEMATNELPPPRRWTRRADHRWLAGVAGGIADGTETPVWVVRLGFVLGVVLGSAGVWLYLLLWWVMPRRDLADSAAQRAARRFPQAPAWLGVGLLTVGVLLFAGDRGWVHPPLLAALILIAIGVLLFVRDTETESAAAGGQGPALPLPAAIPGGTDLPPASLPTAARRRRRRQPSFLGPLTLGAGLLAVGVGALLDLWGGATFTLAQAAALLLLILGVGIAIGGFIGKARWLVIPVLFVVPFALVTNVLHIDLNDGIGERTVVVRAFDRPVVARLGAGELRIDLTHLQPGENGLVRAHLGAGRLLIEVPDDLAGSVDGEIGLGAFQESTFRPWNGAWFSTTSSDRFGFDQIETLTLYARGDDPIATVRIDADVSIGTIEIVHVRSRGGDR